MTKANHYKIIPEHGATREYWLVRHPARIARLELAIEQNTKGKAREKSLREEIAARREHLATLTEGDK